MRNEIEKLSSMTHTIRSGIDRLEHTDRTGSNHAHVDLREFTLRDEVDD
ncbi:MAG: hypothetical protein ACK521_10755 [bacterium]